MMLYGRVGWTLIWPALMRVRTLRQWLLVEIFFTGVLRAGAARRGRRSLSALITPHPALRYIGNPYG